MLEALKGIFQQFSAVFSACCCLRMLLFKRLRKKKKKEKDIFSPYSKFPRGFPGSGGSATETKVNLVIHTFDLIIISNVIVKCGKT